MSKGDLRAQIEKLEAANAALKAKSREANRTAQTAVRRITELEAEVTQLHAAASKTVTSAEAIPPAKAARRGRLGRQSKAIDPGVAVPPGAAGEPPDDAATAAPNAREETLSWGE